MKEEDKQYLSQVGMYLADLFYNQNKMEAKLIKTKVGYHLWLNPETKEQEHIASDYEIVSDNGTDLRKYKLSLKNCQAIERGYDLDELAEKACPDIISSAHSAYKAGFQKALKLNSTKLFTLEDMMNCWNKALKFQDHKETLVEHIQSIQQTEWEVEVEKENVMHDYNGNISLGAKFKLDADGCLILKLKSE
jgi:hypothetical protein